MIQMLLYISHLYINIISLKHCILHVHLILINNKNVSNYNIEHVFLIKYLYD